MNWAVLIIPIARRAFPWASTPPGVNRPRLTKTRITATTAATPAKIIQRRRRLAAPTAFLAAAASSRAIAAASAAVFAFLGRGLKSGVMPMVARLPRPREVGLVPFQPPGNLSLALAPRCGLERRSEE